MIGLRTAGPVALGVAGVSWREFLVFNALGATAWAIAFTTLGYLFGRAIALVLGEIEHYELRAALAIVAAGILLWTWRWWRRRAEPVA
jgi:membrane protein DedA with SNARE-associated domain